jgi:hypothetical protein
MCNGQWGGSVCGSWGKGSHFGDEGARPSRKGIYINMQLKIKATNIRTDNYEVPNLFEEIQHENTTFFPDNGVTNL